MLGTLRRYRSGDRRGLTYIELLVALFVLIVLAGAAMPMLHWDEKRRREKQLRMALQTMRDAIDQYKRLADEGFIVQTDVEQMGYPETLDALIEGIEVGTPGSPEAKTVVFLYKLPVDPFTEKAEWGLRSYQDDWDSTSWGGENVYDVYSLSDLTALDGTSYRDW